MKKTKIIFWIVTGLFSAFMIFSAINDIMMKSEPITKGMLGYPAYIIPFIGCAKLLGIIAILIPGFPRIKEWAYAGLFFDLAGATYSGLALGGFDPGMIFMFVLIAFLFISYFYYHKIRQESAQ